MSKGFYKANQLRTEKAIYRLKVKKKEAGLSPAEEKKLAKLVKGYIERYA